MEEYKTRLPAVAGKFYPASRQALTDNIEKLLAQCRHQEAQPDKTIHKMNVLACMLPHAGYMYSGAVAAETVSWVNVKEKIILLGPNHTGDGADFSIMCAGAWQTPLGEVKIDPSLARKILDSCEYLREDSLAHMYEHSLEVELPFLQYYRNDFEMVPVAIFSDDLEILKEVGRCIASCIKESGLQDKVMIVASSDMTHYEPQGQAERKDKEAIQAIVEMDEDKLMGKIQKLNISMCGYAPVVVMLAAAKALGAKTAKLVRYQTSGDVTGDTSSVVGYAGMIVY